MSPSSALQIIINNPGKLEPGLQECRALVLTRPPMPTKSKSRADMFMIVDVAVSQTGGPLCVVLVRRALYLRSSLGPLMVGSFHVGKGEHCILKGLGLAGQGLSLQQGRYFRTIKVTNINCSYAI